MEMYDADMLVAFRRTFAPRCAADLSDAELVEMANEGRWPAFEMLVERYQDQFFRLACGYFDNEADAQDVVQLAFLKIHRHLEGFRGDAQFKNWAYRIVINTALSRLRKQKRRGEVALETSMPAVEHDSEPVATLASWGRRADEVAENRELRRHIIDAISQLESKYKSVFLLYEVEGLSIEEITEVVDLSVPGVKSRLHRARLFLRATLERYLGEAERLR